jgi:hypothetical protein
VILRDALRGTATGWWGLLVWKERELESVHLRDKEEIDLGFKIHRERLLLPGFRADGSKPIFLRPLQDGKGIQVPRSGNKDNFKRKDC